jgi:hypothetical protein
VNGRRNIAGGLAAAADSCDKYLETLCKNSMET